MNGVVNRTTRAFSPRSRRGAGLRTRRRGLGLLEVVIAMAILAASIAIIAELVRAGRRGAVDARDYTTAQLLCENKMAEIIAGIEPAEAVARATLPQNPATLPQNSEWLYTVEIREIEYGRSEDQNKGIKEVTVLVEKKLPQNTVTVGQPSRQPPRYRLIRWMIDPDYEAEMADAAATAQETLNGTGDDTTTEASSP